MLMINSKAIEADLGIDQGWVADNEDCHGLRFAVEGYQQALENTLQDRINDVDDAARSGPSCHTEFSQLTGNSTNNSCGTACMALNHEGRALRNIELVNANAGLMAELDLGQDTLAATMKKVLLLQAQLGTQSQSQSQDVLPASANDNGKNARNLQGGGGHSLVDLTCNWSNISYVDDTPVPCRQDIIQQSPPPVQTSPDILPPEEVYVPFPPSSGRRSNTYFLCPGWMSEQDQFTPSQGLIPRPRTSRFVPFGGQQRRHSKLFLKPSHVQHLPRQHVSIR
jgi:hypothetical protein